MNNFYKKLNKPFYALAPLAGVADSAFRIMCKGYGADVLYSEMASATALSYAPKKTLKMLEFEEFERPYVVQLFGSEPKHFTLAAKIVAEQIKPNGIDINFGCPVPKVIKQKSGIALFKDLKRSREVIKAVIDSSDLPVSIKTRSRVGEVDILKFLDYMKGLDIKAVMIHGRSASQGFTGEVDANIIKKARNYFGEVIIANGGVGTLPPPFDYDQDRPDPSPVKKERLAENVRDYADWLLEKTKADGIAIGQGALGRPWIFKAIRTGQSIERSKQAVFKEAIRHALLAEKLKGRQGIIEMRKHLCWYVAGLAGAKKLRQELAAVESIKDIRKIFSHL